MLQVNISQTCCEGLKMHSELIVLLRKLES